jgi:hypothetical protein
MLTSVFQALAGQLVERSAGDLRQVGCPVDPEGELGAEIRDVQFPEVLQHPVL